MFISANRMKVQCFLFTFVLAAFDSAFYRTSLARKRYTQAEEKNQIEQFRVFIQNSI